MNRSSEAVLAAIITAVLALVGCERASGVRPSVEPARWDLVAIEDGGTRLVVAVHVSGCDEYDHTEVREGPRGSRVVVSAFVLRADEDGCPSGVERRPVIVELDEPLGRRWPTNCRPREEDPLESGPEACPLSADDGPVDLPTPIETVSVE